MTANAKPTKRAARKPRRRRTSRRGRVSRTAVMGSRRLLPTRLPGTPRRPRRPAPARRTEPIAGCRTAVVRFALAPCGRLNAGLRLHVALRGDEPVARAGLGQDVLRAWRVGLE